MRSFCLLLALALMAGCFSGNSSKESKVDTAMSQGALASNPPDAGPGEPQKSFDQEVNQSR